MKIIDIIQNKTINNNKMYSEYSLFKYLYFNILRLQCSQNSQNNIIQISRCLVIHIITLPLSVSQIYRYDQKT